MNKPELYNESFRATYCPESNLLHLYVGRVPRDEYMALKNEGWRSTPKQSENGGGEFAATWTPERKNTAISYAGFIGDEDQTPADRAADRAERFEGYQEKRLNEATGHAERYESGPSAHGFQSERKAERAASRHDRIGDKASDQWSKTEYWTRRTAGVISHAMHKADAGVRMGRIKVLEAELRNNEADHEKYAAQYAKIQKWAEGGNMEYIISLIAKKWYGGDLAEGTKSVCEEIAGLGKHRNPCAKDEPEGYYFEHMKSANPPTPADYVAQYFATHYHPDVKPRPWRDHLELRLSYENQMLEAQGGRAAMVEMEAGGFVGNHQITKVTKSPATGRVVSVEVEYMSETNQYGRPWSDGKGTRLTRALINIERMGTDIYRAPTDEERAAYAAKVASAKKAKAAVAKEKAAKGENCPLINPTDEDAQRLQDIINERNVSEWIRHHGKPSEHYKPKTASVERITQAVYSANSSGNYAKAETRTLHANGEIGERSSNMYDSAFNSREAARGPALCKIRIAGYDPLRVLIISDKPQKALPAKAWPAPTVTEAGQTAETATQELKAA